MGAKTDRRERFSRWVFSLLALAAPALAAYYIYFLWRTPALDFVYGRDSAVVIEVISGGEAEAAGLRAGDLLLTVNDDTPFDAWHDEIQLGQSYLLGIERDGRRLTVAAPAVSVLQINLLRNLSTIFVTLIFWGSGALLLLRRYQQLEVRLFFLLTQTLAITLLSVLSNIGLWPGPRWMVPLSVVCFHLAAPLLLHYHISFPVLLGSPIQRRRVMGLLYGLVPLAAAGVLWGSDRLANLVVFCAILEYLGAAVIIVYVYLRLAAIRDRRRLRLVVAGTVVAIFPVLLYYSTATLRNSTPIIPEWLVGLFCTIAPLSHLYATARHNLFGIDRLINRALVYIFLSLGILAVYLGPVWLLYRFLPGDGRTQAAVMIGLILLVGLTFDRARTQVQKLVDNLFYGGWYDYPGVVETVSDALARSLDREQLIHVLTRQVPKLMQLGSGELWIGEPDSTIPSRPRPPRWRTRLKVQGKRSALWAVGPRRDGEDLSSADRRILKTLAHQAEIALNNVLLVEALHRRVDEIGASREDLAQAQYKLLRSREEERARLARDLHDEPIQTLVGLNLQLGLLEAPARADDPPLGESLRVMRAEVRQVLGELRQLCAQLRPPMLDTVGLGAALRALAEQSPARDCTIKLDFAPDEELQSLPEEVAVDLYRIAQEALVNVARHAGARQAAIRLAWEDARLVLEVRDDGRGFVAPRALGRLTRQGHFGLVGMRERVELIGGRFALESSPGRGTTVRVTWRQEDQPASL